MIEHKHRFTIADDEAVLTLMDKLVSEGLQEPKSQKLQKALDDAARHYNESYQQMRRAFFHGLLTGYGVALKFIQSAN